MCEILSPVGDKNTFYTAIKSGCDAVYFGLPKFNARLRAENISMDNLPELIEYAHLKGVKCYTTLNTLLSDREITEAVELVGECLKAGVDAFIVQDWGLIYALKSVYPDINLHGSTQMGIHNVHGARVAKSLGLSRIVLSRECTLEDIREIKENVDIELEVFVQGAMCVAFSGNCYMSSIKHGASGNRGECKQLCRLNYTLSDGDKRVFGYPLSIRDNCMLDYLKELVDLGVASFKIEGRLRHSGYIAVATSVYRRAMDAILADETFDIEGLKNELYRVFARGEYIPLYNNGNNVIDSSNNNHMGIEIGEVLSSTPFKDMYKITIKSSTPINAGDGLKFISDKNISMGVGNVEISGKNYIVYGKNYVSKGSKVYKTLDSEFENSVGDYSRRKKVDIDFSALVGNKSRLRFTVEGVSADVFGDVSEMAKTKAVTRETVLEQLTKWDNDIFELGEIDIVLEEVYIPLSKLNDMRRRALVILKMKLSNNNRSILAECSLKDMIIKTPEISYENILLGDESFADWKLLDNYNAFILSPTLYAKNVIQSFINKFTKKSGIQIILNLPIIAMSSDLKIIDDIVDAFKDKVVFMANNIYAVYYAKLGAKVIGGYNLNISNNFSATNYLSNNLTGLTTSIEKNFGRIRGTYKYAGKVTLMTFAHCPQKTLSSNECSKCNYKNMTLSSINGNYQIRRYRINKCYFELVDNKEQNKSGDNLIVDIRS